MATITITLSNAQNPDSVRAILLNRVVSQRYERNSIDGLLVDCLNEIEGLVTEISKSQRGKLPKVRLSVGVSASEESEGVGQPVLFLSSSTIARLASLNVDFGFDPYF
jgi:hypothetical protein